MANSPPLSVLNTFIGKSAWIKPSFWVALQDVEVNGSLCCLPSIQLSQVGKHLIVGRPRTKFLSCRIFKPSE
ncbi:hypothetical protein HanPI659440_Chr14g0529251 [Helianthus annuus]|nr:hypothetical protein HanPI659440_Chr14g0529251 [Helianthus annuus]